MAMKRGLFLQACKNGNFDVALQQIHQGCDPNSVTDVRVKYKHPKVFSRYTPLHYACEKGGDLGFVKTLVETYSCDPHCTSVAGGIRWDRVTPLHLGCRYGRLDIVKYLISEQKCNPQHTDLHGRTSLHWACLSGRLDIVKYLITEQNCSPHCTDELGLTPLHEACRLGGLDIVKYLITEQNCNPQCTDQNGDTLLHQACWEGDLEFMKYLITKWNYEPWCTDSEGTTPLHEACGSGRLDIVKYLIVEGNCNPQCTDHHGGTPLHEACCYGKLDIVKYLITEQNCNPQCTDKDGQTPLHLACRLGRLNVVPYLINCNPRCIDSDRRTPLHIACRYGRLDIVKYLITERNCNPQCTDKDGQTPLHLACRWGQQDIVGYLLREVHCDPNNPVKRTVYNAIIRAEYLPGTPPLGMTGDPGVIRELIECGADPGNILGKLPKICPAQPPELAVKVFVVGEKGAGKSTLTKAISLQKGVWASVVNRLAKVTGVDANTAGIIPHDIKSERFGHTIVYDFAGHKEFYASHGATLRNATAGSTAAIILLVVDLRESNGKIIKSIQSWLHLISSACHVRISRGSKPHLLVVGSWADQLKSDNISRKCGDITSLFPIPEVNYVGFVAVDCRYAASSTMSELCRYLSESCRTLRSQAKANSRCHYFFLYLLQKYPRSPAVSVREIVADFQKPQSKSLTWFAKLIPEGQNFYQVEKLCEELNERGNILLLRNEAIFEESWVVLNQEAMLSRVTGTIFAPKNSGFKQYQEIANTTGVVPFSKVEGIFPNLDPNMLVEFLCHLEFCHEITDPEGPQLLQAATTPNERWFFFPGLVKVNAPDDIWEADDKFVYQSGWLLECCLSHQFFTPHFLQVLLLRLAFSFALALEDSHISPDHPALQRKCSIWKNGICWFNRDGVECLVEIEDRQVLVMLRCPNGAVHELGCIHLRSLVVRMVLGTLEQLCSNISTNEIILHPSDVKYPLNQAFQQFSIHEIAAAIAKAKPSAVSSTGRKTATLEDLLHFEPYTQFVLQELFSESNNDRKISDEYLRHIAYCVRKNTNKFADTFELLITKCFKLREHVFPPLPSDLVQVMQVWRDRSEGSYQCLRRELDQFSVFAGRNPLVLAERETKGTSAPRYPQGQQPQHPRHTPLPSIWEQRIDPKGRLYDVDHNTHATSCNRQPRSWEHHGDQRDCIYYNTKTTIWQQPTAELVQYYYQGQQGELSNLQQWTQQCSLERIDETTLGAHGMDAHQGGNAKRPICLEANDTQQICGDSAAINSDKTTPSSQWSLEKIDDSTLDIRVLYDVNAAIVTVVNWRDLGLALRLSPHTIECIAAMYPRDPSRCLTEVLAAWLQKEGKAPPSWRALVGALRNPSVGKEGPANVIAKAHGAEYSQSDSSDVPVPCQDVDNTPLDTRSDSLYQVNEVVMTLHNWFHLGLALRLFYHTLKRIETDHPQDTRRCLTEMLQAWLEMRDSAAPSWQALTCALSSPIVNKQEVAIIIAASHQKSTR